MSNIDAIKEDYAIGDAIRIVCSLGIKEGIIVDFPEGRIKIRPFEVGRKPISISDDTILDFEEALVPERVNVPLEKSEEITAPHSKEVVDAVAETAAETSPAPTTTQPSPIVEPLVQMPVVKGKIDLDKIDPMGGKRFDVAPQTPWMKALETQPNTSTEGNRAMNAYKSDDNDGLVEACGFIYDDCEKFGWIWDQNLESKVYFGADDINDDQLYDLKSWVGIQVCYIKINNGSKGARAVGICLPRPVYQLLSIADALQDDSATKQNAYDTLEVILNAYPDNEDAKYLQNQVKKDVQRRSKHSLTSKLDMSYVAKLAKDDKDAAAQDKKKNVEKANVEYKKAKALINERKHEEALPHYLAAFEEQKTIPLIRDICSLYCSLCGKKYLQEHPDRVDKAEKYRNEGRMFLEKNAHRLPKELASYYTLESSYYVFKEYEKFVVAVDKVIQSVSPNQGVVFMLKKTSALLALHRTDEAKDVLLQIVKIDPTNANAKNLLEQIDANVDVEELVSTLFDATEFNSLVGGLSPYITQTLDSYNEYYGVPAKIIESGKFEEITLREIRRLIDTAGKARPRERARYLLTEAKIMTTVEPDNILRFRSEMARYCNALALNHIADNSPVDVIKFYYLESFALEDSYETQSTQIALYLLVSRYTYSELLNTTNNVPSVDAALDLFLGKEYDPKNWETLLDMFLYTRDITAGIVSKLYSNDAFRKQSIQALRHFGVSRNINDKDSFALAWNEAREMRLVEYRQVVASIKSMCNAETIEEQTMSLGALLDAKKEWMTPLDVVRFNTIVNNILPILENYVKSSGYRNKEANFTGGAAQVQQLMEEIKETPTKISFELILPLLLNVDKCLNESFEYVKQTSKPIISATLLSSETVIEPDQTVSIQVAIHNDKDSSPIREVSLKVKSTDGVRFVDEENTQYNAIEGGEEHIFRLKLKLSKEIIDSKATVILAICHYKSGTEYFDVESQLSLKLYSSEEFSPIENPYAPIADGGPVPTDSNMFFGREEFIGNIVDSIIASPSKQVIIYGQKRCGKSSVLNHLKKRLQDTGSMFCVFFSMGDIVQNLSEAAFYYKILFSIKQELTNLEFDGVDVVPQYEIPMYNNFKLEDEDNPLNTFMKYIIQFKLACRKTPGWEHKNLVVMIDEFTYLYTEIKNGHVSDSIMKQWKAVTQNERAQFSVVLVGQDVVPSFKKEDYARNAFGVIQDIRLTYLHEEPARDLIIKPILDETGQSRYIGNAVSKIIDYTSRNPYYIQIFCSRLVEYMNRNKSIRVTEADVVDVAQSFICGDQALEEDKFDNLIRAGETEDLQEFPETEILAVLKQVAIGSKSSGYCKKSNVDALEDKDRQDQILRNLTEREVLEHKGNDNYRIQVKLFQEWLLNH